MGKGIQLELNDLIGSSNDPAIQIALQKKHQQKEYLSKLVLIFSIFLEHGFLHNVLKKQYPSAIEQAG